MDCAHALRIIPGHNQIYVTAKANRKAEDDEEHLLLAEARQLLPNLKSVPLFAH